MSRALIASLVILAYTVGIHLLLRMDTMNAPTRHMTEADALRTTRAVVSAYGKAPAAVEGHAVTDYDRDLSTALREHAATRVLLVAAHTRMRDLEQEAGKAQETAENLRVRLAALEELTDERPRQAQIYYQMRDAQEAPLVKGSDQGRTDSGDGLSVVEAVAVACAVVLILAAVIYCALRQVAP